MILIHSNQTTYSQVKSDLARFFREIKREDNRIKNNQITNKLYKTIN